MNLETFFGINFLQILLAFSRTSGLMATAPVFQSRYIPIQARVIFAFALALVVAPFIKSDLDLGQFSFFMVVATLIQEILVGLIIGFMVNLTFYAVQIAGYFFDTSLGFGMINILDPSTGAEMPLLGQFNYIMALMIFLGMNGHHTMILSLIQSYEIIKPGMLLLKREAVGVFVSAFSNMFYLGFKIGLPVIGAIFLTDIALGIVAKLIPQINVFVVGFPIKIIVGLFMLIVFIPVFILLIEATFSNSGQTFSILRQMLRQMHP